MITNYGELQTAVADWLDRSDLGTKIPDFIRMAETDIYRDLRVRDNEFKTTYTLTDNPKNPIALPQNFREIKTVTFNDAPLAVISDRRYASLVANGAQAPTPMAFCMQERDLYLSPWTTEDLDQTGSDFTLTVHYYGTESIGSMAFWDTAMNPNELPESDGTPSDFTERSNASTTRMFLVSPDMYLFGACAYAYMYLRESDKAGEYRSAFLGILGELKNEEAEAGYTGGGSSINNIYG